MEGFESTSVATPSDVSGDSSASEGIESVGNDTGAPSGKVKASDAETLEDLVEISLGSTKAKLPKAIAEQIKNLERGAQKAFQEGASAKKQLKEFEATAKKNPKGFLQQFGIDPYEFSEMTLAEKLELMAMSPEQKEHLETKRRLGEFEEREKAAAAERERLEYTRQETELQQTLDNEIAVEFQKSGLPKHPFFVQQICAAMLGAEKRGESLSAAQAASMIKNRFEKHLGEVFEHLDPAGIQRLLPESVRKKLREFEVKRVTDGSAPTLDSSRRPGTPPASNPAPKRVPNQPLSEREWREKMRSDT